MAPAPAPLLQRPLARCPLARVAPHTRTQQSFYCTRRHALPGSALGPCSVPRPQPLTPQYPRATRSKLLLRTPCLSKRVLPARAASGLQGQQEAKGVRVRLCVSGSALCWVWDDVQRSIPPPPHRSLLARRHALPRPVAAAASRHHTLSLQAGRTDLYEGHSLPAGAGAGASGVAAGAASGAAGESAGTKTGEGEGLLIAFLAQLRPPLKQMSSAMMMITCHQGRGGGRVKR